MEYKEFTAKTVDEAITQACLALGVTSDRLDYDVTQEPSAGFLGLGSRPAVIRARARSEEEIMRERAAMEAAEKALFAAAQASEPEVRVISSDEIEQRAAAAAARAQSEGTSAPESRDGEEGYGRRARRDRGDRREREGRERDGRGDRRGSRGRSHDRRREFAEETEIEIPDYEPSKPRPDRVVKERSEEEAAELCSAAENFLKEIFGAMQISAEITTAYDPAEGSVNCTFDGEEMGLLIGKRGQTLDSLQYLTSLVVNRKTDDYVRVKLDTEDYRFRRAETLNNLARNIAYKVKKTRRPVALEPMNPYERRIIHSSLQGNRFVETFSEGDEPFRHVVVVPKR